MAASRKAGPVTSAEQRQRELYRAPANATIAQREAEAVRPTVSTTEALARLDRSQAAIMRGWCADLERAQRAGDWTAVAAVRTGLHATAVVLEECAGDAALLGAGLAALEAGQ